MAISLRKYGGHDGKGGFSLVEVCMAVMLIGAGVLVLFALFPAGLKQSDSAVADTHVAMFAETTFSGIRAKAMAVQDWDVWKDINKFRAQVVNTVLVNGVFLHGDGLAWTLADYVETDVGVTYKLEIGEVSGRPELRYASLKVCFGNQWDDNRAQWFYTEFFYSGMP